MVEGTPTAEAQYDERENFLGWEPRECGDHRTCGGRAWCFNCSEWCTPNYPCVGCERPQLLARLLSAEKLLTEVCRDGLTEPLEGAIEVWLARGLEERKPE